MRNTVDLRRGYFHASKNKQSVFETSIRCFAIVLGWRISSTGRART